METIFQSRVTVLVKASPQPSKSHSETVCCAGLEETGKWKRLFPIRFRRLEGDKAFVRWDIVEFKYRTPKDDPRIESCRVLEESIQIAGKTRLPEERAALIERAIVDSEKHASELGHSLAVIRPQDVSLSWKARSKQEINEITAAFRSRAAQLSLLEDEIKAYQPCPYRITMRYRDADGQHSKTCADWETDAAFFKLRQMYEETDVLKHLRKTYCEDYVAKGLVFALGNMKKRPQTWQLLGIFPVAESMQGSLF